MERLARLQIIGPLAIFGAVLAAETVAYALSQAPSSSLLWYLNLEVFSIFRKSRASFGGLFDLPFAQLLMVAGPLALLGCLGLALKRNLLVAVSSNLSFVYAAFLVYGWHHWQSIGRAKAASLAWVDVPTGSDLYLFVLLLLTSFISFTVSHFVYIRAARSEA